MDDQPFRKWGRSNNGFVVGFGLLICAGLAGILFSYWFRGQYLMSPDPSMIAFALYGGIVAVVIGVIGLIGSLVT